MPLPRPRLPSVPAAVLSLLLSAPAAHAARGPRAHDKGFFLRLSAGAATVRTSLEDASGSPELSGAGLDVNLAAGAVVAPNLAVHGTLFGWLVADPEVERSGNHAGEVGGDLDLTAVGVGVTYYLMPANVYVSGSVGAAVMTLDSGPDVSDTDTGFAGDFTVGKEWRVSERWGLGVAGAVGFHALPVNDLDESWTGTSFALRVTATRN